MIYIQNKKIVDALGKATDPPVIDCENAPEIEFQLLDAAGEAVAPEAGVVYTFTGAVSFYGKGVIFGADCTPEVGDETLVFSPDTYNSDYIREFGYDGQSIFIQIHKGGDGGPIVMWGKSLAKPRIADPAQPPAPIASYYTAAQVNALLSPLTGHVDDTDNPHNVTATQVGLGNVNNTSDANKPVSTATGQALALKADLEDGKVPLSQLPAFSSTLAELTDTDIDDPAAGETLVYDGAKWANGFPTERQKYYPIPPAYSALTDACVALDDVSNICEVDPAGVSGMVELEFQIMSASSTVTGNVRLDVKQGSTILVSATVPVTLAYVKQTIELPAPVTGHVDLYRDTAHADDTLEDGGIIPAALRLFYGYEVRP